MCVTSVHSVLLGIIGFASLFGFLDNGFLLLLDAVVDGLGGLFAAAIDAADNSTADQAASEEGHEDREANDRGQLLASLSDLFFSVLRLSSRA